MESLTQHQKNFDGLQARVYPLEDEERGVRSILIKLNNTTDLIVQGLRLWRVMEK